MNDIIQQLVSIIDLHDLATWLGMERGTNKLYFAPWRSEGTASISVYEKGKRWKDHGDATKRGSAIDLYRYCRDTDTDTAIRALSEHYGLSRPVKVECSAPESREAYIWRVCSKHKDIQAATDYLEKRKVNIPGLAGKAWGYTDYKPPNEHEAHLYPPGVVFPCRNPLTGELLALNIRYIEAAATSKRMIGNASGTLYCPDWSLRNTAKIVLFCEAPIDALSAWKAGYFAVSILSTSMVEHVPLDWVKRDQECRICLDWDEEGREASRTLWHRCIDAGLCPSIVENPRGDGVKDLNDVLRVLDEGIANVLETIDQNLMAGEDVFLPSVEYRVISSIKAHHDSMTSIKQDPELGEVETLVAGMRVYRIDSLLLHSPLSAITGAYGHPQRKSMIHYRRVDSPRMLQHNVDAGDLGRPTTWQGLSWVYNPYAMGAATQALARGQRRTVEKVPVIGLCRTPRGVMFQDGPDSQTEPEQCPYSSLSVDSGTAADAASIVEAMRALLLDDIGLIALAWSVGTGFKSIAGFWPHLVISAPASSGKSTVLERLSHATSACVFDFSELETGYRRMRLLSNHLMPVFIDEASRASKEATSGFLDLMNAAYMGTLRHHANKQNLIGGAAALVGQDMPETDAAILSKTVIIDLSRAKGRLIQIKGTWPYREWGAWLASRYDRDTAGKEIADRMKADATALKLSGSDGDVSERLRRNYAAVGLIIDEVLAFSNMAEAVGATITRPWLSSHIQNTAAIRRESTAILDQLARDLIIDSNARVPHRIEGNNLILPPSVILDYLHSRGHRFAVNTTRRLIDHLATDGYLADRGIQQSINGVKYSACIALSLRMMELSGIHWPKTDYQPR